MGRGFIVRSWRATVAASLLLLGLAPLQLAQADGTETLGPPGLTLASGSGVVTAGTGMRTQPQSLGVTVPAAAVVKQVLLYWEGVQFEGDPPDPTIVVNGNQVTGTLIGGPTFFFPDFDVNPPQQVFSASYRADITGLNLVGPGANSLALSGLTNSRANDGASVVVIYDDGSGAATIGVLDGLDLAYAGFQPPRQAMTPQTFTFGSASFTRTANLSLMIGTVQTLDNTILVTIDGTTTSYHNLLTSFDGPEWDNLVIPVSIPAGATTVTVQPVSEGANPASLVWVSAVLATGLSSLTVRAPSLSFVYGDVIPASFTPIYEGLVGGDTQPATPATCTSDAHTGSDVGAYSITCSGAADPAYTISYVAQPALVTPRPLVIQPTGTQTYGSDEASVTATYVGLAPGDTAPETPPTCTHDGLTLTCSGAADPNYDITYEEGTLTITPADLTVQAPSLSIPYGDAVPATFPPTYLGLTNGDTAPDTLPTCATTAHTGDPAGGYPVTCTGAADPNYTVIHAPGSLTITRVGLTVQAPSVSKAYGQAVPELLPTYIGLVNGDLTPDTPAVCSTTATSGSPTGSYPVTCPGAADPNYTITDSPGTLVVSGAGLIVQAPSVTKAYGEALPAALPPVYVGLTNGDTAPSTPATCSTPATTSSPVGTYPVTCSGAAGPSYEITYQEGTLTITKVALSVQAPSASKAYGDPVPALAPTYSGLTNGDTSPATAATCSTTAATASAVTTYPVTCGGAADTNYDIGYAQGLLSVTKVTLTVSADSPSRAYGQPNPALGASYSGFALGQTLATSGVTGAPSCTTTAVTASAPGTYPVTCTVGSLQSGNYAFTSVVAGTLTVTKLGTALVAKPAVLVPSLLSVKVTMSARLTSLVTGLAISGQSIHFALGAASCNATTNANGEATCFVSVLNAVWVLLGRDYSASYAGTVNYLSSSAIGQAKLL